MSLRHQISTNCDELNNYRQLSYSQLLLFASAIGVFGGLVATVYYLILESLIYEMWHTFPELIKPYFPSWLSPDNYVGMAKTVGGFCVGLALYLSRYEFVAWIKCLLVSPFFWVLLSTSYPCIKGITNNCWYISIQLEPLISFSMDCGEASPLIILVRH